MQIPPLLKLFPVIFVLCASTLAVSAQAPQKITAFVNVNVVPMDSERVLTGQTVVVRDGRITEIGEAAKVKIPEGAMRIDAPGKYLMPGLADMHVHGFDNDERTDAKELFLY